jgi:RNase P/RNase MRP subunit p29
MEGNKNTGVVITEPCNRLRAESNPVIEMRAPIALREFCGMWVRVSRSGCKALEGIQGTVLKETKNTLVLKTDGRTKRIPKRNCLFLFPETGEEVKGDSILYAPEERTEKLFKKMMK